MSSLKVILHGLARPIRSSWGDLLLAGRILRTQYPERHLEKQLPLSVLERSVMAFLVALRSLSLSHLNAFISTYKGRSAFSETYVIFWLAVLATLAANPLRNSTLLWIVVGYRMVDAFNYRLCIIFVDRHKSDWGLRSLNRSLILLLLNYCEIVLGFSALYQGAVTIVRDGIPISSSIDALYFSLVTITTLGYGDFTPVDSVGKMTISVEVVMGVVLLVLVIGSFLAGVRGMDKEYDPDAGSDEG